MSDLQEFSEMTRWRLFDDARYLAKEGQIGYDRVLQLISFAGKDRIFLLWFRIFDFVHYFRRMVYDTDVYSDFQVWTFTLSLKVYTLNATYM